MKKLVISCITVIIIIGAIFIVGSEVINQSWRPTLNANEKIISKSLDKGGKPKDIIGNIPETDISKKLDEAYVSVKVNHRDFKKGKITLKYNDKVIDDVVNDVSEDGYISYHVDNIKNMDNGFYQLLFYDEKDELNVCAGFDILE